MKRKKIINILTVGESSVLIKGQLPYLKQAGYDVALVASPSKKLEEFSIKEDVRTLPIEMKREISLIKDLISLFKILNLLTNEKPDIVNSGTPKAGLLGTLAAYLCRVPFKVYTLRGLRYEGEVGFKRKLLMFIEKIICSLADKVICISPSLEKKAINDGIVSSKKTMVLGYGSSNGLLLEEYNYDNATMKRIDEIKNVNSIEDKDFIIGFVGRINRDKGIIELIESFLQLQFKFSNIKLLIIGEREFSPDIPDYIINEIENNKSIIEVGFTSNVIPYYHLMDVLAFPTHREGFGNVAIEAQATATPVITTNATGAVDTVVNGKTGFIIKVGDKVGLEKSLEKFITSPELIKEMGRSAKERVYKCFSSKIIWDDLDKLYNDF